MVEKIVDSSGDWNREPNEYERFLGDMSNILINEILTYEDSRKVIDAKDRYLTKLEGLERDVPDDAVYYRKLYNLACDKLERDEKLGFFQMLVWKLCYQICNDLLCNLGAYREALLTRTLFAIGGFVSVFVFDGGVWGLTFAGKESCN